MLAGGLPRAGALCAQWCTQPRVTPGVRGAVACMPCLRSLHILSVCATCNVCSSWRPSALPASTWKWCSGASSLASYSEIYVGCCLAQKFAVLQAALLWIDRPVFGVIDEYMTRCCWCWCRQAEQPARMAVGSFSCASGGSPCSVAACKSGRPCCRQGSEASTSWRQGRTGRCGGVCSHVSGVGAVPVPAGWTVDLGCHVQLVQSQLLPERPHPLLRCEPLAPKVCHCKQVPCRLLWCLGCAMGVMTCLMCGLLRCPFLATRLALRTHRAAPQHLPTQPGCMQGHARVKAQSGPGLLGKLRCYPF
jgi:hypothetical protein